MNVVRNPPRAIGAARLVPTPAELRPDLKSAWPWLFWALWGAWLAVSDLRDPQLQPSILRMIAGAAVLGFARPRTWWLWSLALAAWIPAEALVADALRFTPAADLDLRGWLVSPLPALVGGFLGRGIAASVAARRPR